MKTIRFLEWFLLILKLELVLGVNKTNSNSIRSVTNRVIGGFAANPARFPYFTRLIISLESGDAITCGGSLIASDIVLTAAHCITTFPINSVEALVNRTRSEKPFGRQYRRNVVEINVHPDYNAKKNQHDLALVRLGSPVIGVPRVKINRKASTPVEGQWLTVMGFGVLNQYGAFPRKLMQVAVQAFSHQDCNDATSYDGFISEDAMLCAGIDGGGKDSCGGDSGGPLIVSRNSASRDVQVGIVSFGYGCAIDNKPGVYTRVSSYFNWIHTNVCSMSRKKPSYCPSSSDMPAPSPTNGKATTKPSSLPTIETPETYCFSGEMVVTVKNRGKIQMKNLRIYDEVLVSIENDSYEAVYSFGHVNRVVSARFLVLEPSNLELSYNHMVFLKGKGPVPASRIELGDELVGGQQVLGIRYVTRRGVFAPFTLSGRIVVNDVLASTYVAFQDSKVLMIGSSPTFISHQWLAHTFQFPQRIWCFHLGACIHEHHTEKGISSWTFRALDGCLWIFDQHWSVVFVCFVPIILVLALLAGVETSCVTFPGVCGTLLLVILSISFFCRGRLIKISHGGKKRR